MSYPAGKDSVENYINFVSMNLFVFTQVFDQFGLVIMMCSKVASN